MQSPDHCLTVDKMEEAGRVIRVSNKEPVEIEVDENGGLTVKTR